jgi:hypothetical protein
MKRATISGILVAVLLALAINAAAADNWYAVTKLRNGTNFELRFQYRFGAGAPWHSAKLHPGVTETFWYKYKHANADNSPGVEIKLDADMTRDIVVRDYHLQAHACPNHSGSCAGHHVLLYDAPAHRLKIVKQ